MSAAGIDALDIGFRDVVAKIEIGAERLDPVAAREEVDIPHVIRLQDDQESRRAGVEPVPQGARIVGRRDRIEQSDFAL